MLELVSSYIYPISPLVLEYKFSISSIEVEAANFSPFNIPFPDNISKKEYCPKFVCAMELNRQRINYYLCINLLISCS